jgi:uncharacterized protein (DUF1501 family)
MKKSRRVFIRRTGLALGGAAFASSFKSFGLINALAQKGTAEDAAAPDYKALVCVCLFGGNDGNNMIIPYDGYSAYSTIRGPLAIPQASLLQITPPSHGVSFGLHPNLSPEVATPTQRAGLLPLWQQQKLAVLCNVGTLYAPMTRAQYLANSVPRPENLFSHEDQTNQHQSSVVRNTLLNEPTGWGGRLADSTQMLNGSATFPMIVSLSGVPLFATTPNTRPIVPGPDLTGFSNPPTSDARYNAMQYLMTVDREPTLVNAASDTMQRAVANTGLLNQATNDAAAVATVFPSTGLGNQLRSVARIIAKRSTLFGLQRQIFFCSLGGFDTHTNQLTPQGNLFTQLSQAMRAFYDATVELGISTQVTTFTLSDFGRTLKPTDTGSDHAWGNHQLIMGGSVVGGNFYGTFPRLALSAGDDTGNEGRWIPTTALDQYGATLATWFGLSGSDLATVFPNIGRFTTSNLGFLV